MKRLIRQGWLWLLVTGVICGMLCGASPASAEELSVESAKRLIVRVRAKNTPGAGIIFSVRGGYFFIATAYHVVNVLKPGKTAEVEFEFLRGISVQADVDYTDKKLDLAVLKVNIAESPLRNVRIALLPFHCLCDTASLKRGDNVYPVGHPEGELWDVPVIPAQIKKVVAEAISLQPRCFPGHSGGGLFDEHWRLVGMLTTSSGNTCEAVSFWRICATLEGDWGLVVNREPYDVQLSTVVPIPSPVVYPSPTLTSSKEWTDPVTGIEFVWIPPGCFQMGQTEAETNYLIKEVGKDDYEEYYQNELPRHQVCIQEGFWMGKYEVTQAQWQHIMGSNPSYFTTEKVGQNSENHPVENVSWDTVQEFIQKASMKAGTTRYRLPSETEWEYAVRAGTETMFSFGNDAKKLNEYAWYRENSGGTTHPVGQLKPNAWGLYDMHGNVWEWCEDVWHDSYHGAPSDGSAWHSGGIGNENVVRGGSWNYDPPDLRSSVRAGEGTIPGYRIWGFRLCVTEGGQ